MSIFNTLWLVLIFATFLLPLLRQRNIERQRYVMIKRLEQRRQTRVITLIHRQEAINLLGIPIARYINIEDSEQVLRAIRMTPQGMPIDIILHTPGGLVLAAEQVALAIQRHEGKVTVFVPHYAMSGGTMLAIAADEIVMDENAVLGPIDPQLGSYPAASILRVMKEKPIKDIDDETIVMVDMAEKALSQVYDSILGILKKKMDADKAGAIAKILTQGRWTHDYPLTYEHLTNLGLPVKIGLPTEVYSLMPFIPQPPQQRPSVQYIPVPYRENKTRS